MSLHFHWFLPTNGDGRDIVGGGHGVATGSAGTVRPASLGYLGQIARSAEQLGFEAALTPTGAWCEDAWLVTGMLTEVTERLKFLVAFRPGLVSPTLAAQMAATFQRYSSGRLLLNVVTGGETAEQQAYGDFLGKAQRYQRCAEFLDIVTRLWRGETVSHDGEHLRVEGARLSRRPDPVPALYFGGSSAEAGPVAARYSDVYLTWGEPPDAVDAKLRWMDGLARQAGRTLRYGIRLHVSTRDTSHEAWLQANRLIEGIDEAMIRKVQEGLAHSESEGQRRMRQLHGGSPGDLEVSPNLWAGVGLLRGGAGTALVGSHTEVADRIEEYAALGISEFILSGYPHLEEAYWLAGRHGARAIALDHPVNDRRRELPRHPDRLRAGAEHRYGAVTASGAVSTGTADFQSVCGVTTCLQCYPRRPVVKYYDRISRFSTAAETPLWVPPVRRGYGCGLVRSAGPGAPLAAAGARVADALPSSCSCGTTGSSQCGIHQAWVPSRDITDGTRIIRTREASMSTAKAIPMASIFTVGSGFSTKLVKTTTMMAAAVVMTLAVAPIPIATLRCGSPVLSQASCTRDSRKTS